MDNGFCGMGPAWVIDSVLAWTLAEPDFGIVLVGRDFGANASLGLAFEEVEFELSEDGIAKVAAFHPEVEDIEGKTGGLSGDVWEGACADEGVDFLGNEGVPAGEMVGDATSVVDFWHELEAEEEGGNVRLHRRSDKAEAGGKSGH